MGTNRFDLVALTLVNDLLNIKNFYFGHIFRIDILHEYSLINRFD
jgi:hypothetical protein